MKPVFALFFVLPLLLASCDHHDDVPDVDVTVTVSGCTVVDDVIYIVQGDGFKVVSVNLENHGGKNAVIGSVVYLWDYVRVGDSMIAPYSYNFNTSAAELGRHVFQLEAAVYAVDYAPAIAFLSYDVIVVDKADDVPGGSSVDPAATFDLMANMTKGAQSDSGK